MSSISIFKIKVATHKDHQRQGSLAGKPIGECNSTWRSHVRYRRAQASIKNLASLTYGKVKTIWYG